MHDVLKEVRRVVDKYPGDPVLITEADEPNIEELTKMYGNGDEVQLPMDFQIADVNQLSAPRFRKLFDEVENNSAHGQPEYFFSNHDQPRQWDRYGDGVHNDQIAKLMAVLELATRGTPQMYYGEELGMRTTDPARIEDVHDPDRQTRLAQGEGPRRRAHAHAVGRQRRMPASRTAGKPWLPVPPSAKTYNVGRREQGPKFDLQRLQDSCWRCAKQMRRCATERRRTSTRMIPTCLRFCVAAGRSTVLVALNMSGKGAHGELSVSDAKGDSGFGRSGHTL